MLPDRFLAQRNRYKYYKTGKLLLKSVLAKSFFSDMKQADVFESVTNVLKLAADGERGSGR